MLADMVIWKVDNQGVQTKLELITQQMGHATRLSSDAAGRIQGVKI